MDEEPDYPNTKRYWRINEMEALKMMTQFRDASLAESLEEYNTIIEDKQRLRELQAQEGRLLARFERMTGRNLAEEAKIRARQHQPQQNPSKEQILPAEELDLPF